ncbi:MAG: GNAT family N-acetyltransferase [Cyanobacteriota bacterium]
MNETYQDFLIRSWEKRDSTSVNSLIAKVLAEYGLDWDPIDTDRDVVEVETFYQQTGGEFWLVEAQGKVVGSAGYYPISRGNKAVEIRKMYLLPEVRGKGLGQFLLNRLESAIAQQNYQEIWIETATVLKEAIKLYEKNGYQLLEDVETSRCDRAYIKFL